jgi:hypothetical protein
MHERAGRLQLMRKSLGSGYRILMRVNVVQLSVVLLLGLFRAPTHALALQQLEVRSDTSFRAADGTISRIRKGGRRGPDQSISLVPVKGGFELTFVVNDAAGCKAPQSIKHRNTRDGTSEGADSVTITLRYDFRPCPAIYTPAAYTLSMQGLVPGWHHLRVQTQQGDDSAGTWLSYTLQTQ